MAGPEPVQQIKVNISLEPSEDTPVYYANYAEVGQSQYDFGISFVRVPVKLPALLMAEARESGTMTLTPDIHVVVPHALVPGLIDALQKQLSLLEDTK